MSETLSSGEALGLVRAAVAVRGSQCKELSVLNDWQLLQVAQWIADGKSNDFIGRAVKELWGQCPGVGFEPLMAAIGALRRKLFSGPDALAAQVDFSFDPVAENAALVRKLWEEREYWSGRAKQRDALAIHLEKADRITRLLSEAIANHATIQNKHGQGTGKGGAINPGASVNINEIKVLIGEMRTDRMPDFIEELKSEIKVKAKLDTTKKLQ